MSLKPPLFFAVFITIFLLLSCSHQQTATKVSKKKGLPDLQQLLTRQATIGQQFRGDQY